MSVQEFKLKGAHVLGGLLLFFAAIFAIDIAFAIAAVQTFPGEDERRSYTQGLRYNDVLAERRAQASIGWRAEAVLSQSQTGARLVVRLTESSGVPISNATIDAVLRWPPNESGDRALRFAPSGQGIYTAELGPLEPGRWDLRARAHDSSAHALDFAAELTWPTR